MSGPAAVQLLILDILSWMSAIVMVTGFCPWKWLWSSLKSPNHWTLDGNCWFLLPKCFSSADHSHLLVGLLSSYYPTTESTNERTNKRTSISLLYIFRQVARLWAFLQPVQCLPNGQLDILPDRSFMVLPFSSSHSWLTSLCFALILACNHLIHGGHCSLWLVLNF